MEDEADHERQEKEVSGPEDVVVSLSNTAERQNEQ